MDKVVENFKRIYPTADDAMREAKAVQVAFSRQLSGYRGLNGHVKAHTLAPYSEALGYTREGNPIDIFVAFYHPIMKDLTHAEIVGMRMGIGLHEILHQIFTPFSALDKMIAKEDPALQAQFHNLCNILEDARIEWLAPTKMGGSFLKALQWTRDFIYLNQPDINEMPGAYGQFTKAMGDFATKGKLKGEITETEAKEVFEKALPLIAKAVRTASGKEAVKIYKKVWDIAKSLIPSKEESDQLQEDFQMSQKQGLETQTEPLASPSTGNLDEIAEELLKELEKAQEESEEESSSSETSSSSSEEEESSEETQEKGEGSEGNEENDEASDNDSNEASDSDSNEAANEVSDEAADETSSGSPEEASNETSDEETDEDSDDTNPTEKTTQKPEEEFTDEDAADFRLDEISKEIQDEVVKASQADEIDIPEMGDLFRGIECLQIKKPLLSQSAYNAQVGRMSWAIRKLTNVLKDLLKPEAEEKDRKSCGRYNVTRAAIGTSAKIFDRRTEPGSKKDVAVMIILDESGSMTEEDNYNGVRRFEGVRDSAIMLAEAFDKVKIPYYIMGYSTYPELNHSHYVRWDGKNKPSLLGINGHGCNFDSYAIEYASKLLAKRSETQKLLIIISDGTPSYAVASMPLNAYEAVTKTVRDAKKRGQTIIGIGVGRDCEPEILQGFYGANFIWQPNPEMLASTIAQRLERVLTKLLK